MKIIYLFLFFINIQYLFSQKESTKFNWGEVYTRKDSPMRLDLISSNKDNYYFTTGVRAPNIQDILSFDKYNFLIGLNTYYKMHPIKHIIRFNENNIFLVSLKKKKGRYTYYASKFNNGNGDFGSLFTMDALEEKTDALNLYFSYNSYNSIVKDKAGWAVSSDEDELVLLNTVINEDENLHIRISYFNDELKKSLTRIVKLNLENAINDIEDFILLENGSVVVLVNSFTSERDAKKAVSDWDSKIERVPTLIFIDKQGQTTIEKLKTEFTGKQKLINTEDNGYYYISLNYEELNIINFEGLLKERFSKEYLTTDSRSNLKVRQSEKNLFFVFEKYDLKSRYDSYIGKVYYKKYSGFMVISIDKKTGQEIINEDFESKYGVSSEISNNNELYLGFRNPVKRNKEYNPAIMKLTESGELFKTIVPNKWIDAKEVSPYFWILENDRLLYEIRASEEEKIDKYQFGTIRMEDLKFKEE